MATIQGVYVALFGRPADPTGLAYFNSVTKSGADLSAIGDLASTQEYKDRFAGQSNTQIVSSIYQSLFNRTPETAGLTFFVDALNKGTLNIKNIAIAILDGAQGDDKTIATNKITAADNFTKAIDTPVEVGSYQGNNAAQLGRNFLTPVGKDAATIPSTAATDAALLAIVNATPGSTGTTGVTIQLTAITDAVSPNAANPSFKSTAGDDTINAGNKIGDASNIDAGAGVDTLKIATKGVDATSGGGTAAADSITATPTLAGVEKIFVSAAGGKGNANITDVGGSAAVSLDLSKSSGIKELWNDGSAAGAAGVAGAGGAGGAASVEFKNITLGTQLGLKGTITDDTTFAFKGVSGNSDSATLSLSGVTDNTGTKAVKIDGIETLNVVVDGTSKIGSLVDSTLDKVVITGTGDLELKTTSTTVKTVDASALSGKAIVDVSASAAGVSFTGGKQADTVTFKIANDVTDTVVFNANNKSTASLIDTVAGLHWKNVAGTAVEDKVDLSAFKLGASTAITALTRVGAETLAIDGASFGSNKVATSDFGGAFYIYVDTSGDGKFNVAEDLVFKVNTLTDFTKDNIIWS